MPKLKIGDLVVLKSGGPLMTLVALTDSRPDAGNKEVFASSDDKPAPQDSEEKYEPDPTVPSAVCMWFTEPRDYVKRDTFPLAALDKAPRRARPPIVAPATEPAPRPSRYEVMGTGSR